MAQSYAQSAPPLDDHALDCQCFRCKLRTLNFTKSGHVTHAINGDPWANNPVADRIKELYDDGAKVEAQINSFKGVQ